MLRLAGQYALQGVDGEAYLLERMGERVPGRGGMYVPGVRRQGAKAGC